MSEYVTNHHELAEFHEWCRLCCSAVCSDLAPYGFPTVREEELDDDELESAATRAELRIVGWVPDDIPGALGMGSGGDGADSGGGSSVCI